MRFGRVLAGAIAAAILGAAIARGAGTEPGAATLQGDPAAGEALFQDRCATCHLAEGGGQGPSLKGVFGRKAGSAPGFAYSTALRTSGLTWTGPDLDRFLADPRQAVPGTAMPIKVEDTHQRADLIRYLAGSE